MDETQAEAARQKLARLQIEHRDLDDVIAQLIDAIGGFVSRTLMRRGVLDVQNFRVRFGPTDSTLDVLAADAPSAWGLRSHGVFVDEIAQWATTPGTAPVGGRLHRGSQDQPSPNGGTHHRRRPRPLVPQSPRPRRIRPDVASPPSPRTSTLDG